MTRPLSEVWALFQDVPVVARCMPGAELLEDKGNGAFVGRVAMKLGPFNAAFEGEAQVTVDVAKHSGHVEGRGTDKRGGSRSKLTLDYRLFEAVEGTKVDIDADIQLSGPIAQFGRTGIITETANVLIRQFVQNVEAKLTTAVTAADNTAAPAPSSASAESPLSVLGLMAATLASFFRRFFGGSRV